MPELPEVETVKRGLEELLDLPHEVIQKIEFSDKKLRFQADLAEFTKVNKQKILGIKRRAKYLLFELKDFFLISHLGMTGSWRIEEAPKKHDHIRIFLGSQRVLTYHDARRFGFFDILAKSDLNNHKYFSHLGLEPVDEPQFSTDYLYSVSRGRKTPVKAFVMNQTIVVGVGNIYASEALYLSGIHPLKLASELSRSECQLLVQAIVAVLNEAIRCGGTTISDFKQAGGSDGYFQNNLLVYGRDGEVCHFCQDSIISQAIVGRNSFWCPGCQKLL